MKKYYQITAITVLLIVLVAGASVLMRPNSNCHQGDSPPAADCVYEQIELTGNVDVRQVNLAFKVPGRVAEILVEEGDFVRGGQIIAHLEEPDFQNDVDFARARHAASSAKLLQLKNGARPQEIEKAKALVNERRATVENARRRVARRAELADQGFTAHQSHEDAEAALREAEARLHSAIEELNLVEAGPRLEEIEQARAAHAADRAALALSERRLFDTKLLAPNNGIILTRVREPGAIVAVGETIANLSLSSPVWVRTYIEEPDLGYIEPGMPATVDTDAGRSYIGQVGFVSPVAEFTPKSVETRELRTSLVYRVRVIIDGADGGLRQGMPVSVTLTPVDNRDEQAAN